METKKSQTFQEQYRKFYLVMIVCGYYPPGIEKMFPNKLFLLFQRGYFYFLWWLCNIYCLMIIVYLLVETVPLGILFLMLRRLQSIAPYSIMVGLSVFETRRGKMNALFDKWNDFIASGYYLDRRRELMDRKFKTAFKIYFVALVFGILVFQIPTIIMWFVRDMKGANFVLIPHDQHGPMHYYYLAYQQYFLCFGTFLRLNYHFMLISMLTMGETQLQILRRALYDIFSKITFDEKGEPLLQTPQGKETLTTRNYNAHVVEVRKELKKWLDIHYETLSWLSDMQSYMLYPSSIKLLFFGVYVCLAVFCVPLLIKNGSLTEIVFILTFAIGFQSVFWYETRVAEEIPINSAAIFRDCYQTAWFMYPRDIVQSLSIIDYRSWARPVRFKAMSIFEDNSDTLLFILNTAYKALSFLLNLEV